MVTLFVAVFLLASAAVIVVFFRRWLAAESSLRREQAVDQAATERTQPIWGVAVDQADYLDERHDVPYTHGNEFPGSIQKTVDRRRQEKSDEDLAERSLHEWVEIDQAGLESERSRASKWDEAWEKAGVPLIDEDMPDEFK